ncbi:LOW QUALITY PROTEIN: tetraspanin-18-like [Phasianus colchicus]|uniref:LOW QUALITY PROTEIN: tetraspanin-18-like n=1 Tax=Phasianus colchicus TaxID=9054 RepID=UPI00129E718F|nr:LOW QUALITY PROTEIN: tetraspanin-18-like [Phasianus colchicus]
MGVLSCMKYLMFVFNVLVFVSPAGDGGVQGAVLRAVKPSGAIRAELGCDAPREGTPALCPVTVPCPTGRGDLPAKRGGLGGRGPGWFPGHCGCQACVSVGAYLLLAVGIALSLLGFLGCCGALQRSRPLLLVFFVLVSLVFVTQLVGAVLFLAHWKQIRPELFLSELRRNYCGDEGAEVFSVAWNTLMVTVSGREAPAGVWNTRGCCSG